LALQNSEITCAGIHHWSRQLREKDHGSDGLEREMPRLFQGVANGRRMKKFHFCHTLEQQDRH
jgi:hypothetical protein